MHEFFEKILLLGLARQAAPSGWSQSLGFPYSHRFFGSSAASFQRLLHLLVERCQLVFGGLCRDCHRTAEVGAGAREWLGDDHPVPRIELPGSLDRNVKAVDRLAGLLGQQDGSGLGDVARPARAVDGKHRRVSQLDFAPHSDQRANAASRTRSPDRTKPEFTQNAGYIFAIEAAADHHRYFPPAKTVACRQHAAVPETPDTVGCAPAVAQAIGLTYDLEAQRWPQAANQQVSAPSDEPQRDSLAQRETALRAFRNNMLSL